MDEADGSEGLSAKQLQLRKRPEPMVERVHSDTRKSSIDHIIMMMRTIRLMAQTACGGARSHFARLFRASTRDCLVAVQLTIVRQEA